MDVAPRAGERLVAGSEIAWNETQPYLRFVSRDVVLELAVRLSHWTPGHIMEFGVYRGNSTRILRRSLSQCKRAEFGGPRKKIYACDSFEGLPEGYEKLKPGTFACKPPRIRGVKMVKGYYEDSLTPQLAAEVKQVALASLDADLYSSTACVLKWLTPCWGPAASFCSMNSLATTARRNAPSTNGAARPACGR